MLNRRSGDRSGSGNWRSGRQRANMRDSMLSLRVLRLYAVGSNGEARATGRGQRALGARKS